jgi:hypothetical protein
VASVVQAPLAVAAAAKSAKSRGATYQTDSQVGRWLLDAIPEVVVRRADEWDSPVVPLLATEIVKDEPGQQVVLDRLLDLLLVTALRAAFASDRVEVPA